MKTYKRKSTKIGLACIFTTGLLVVSRVGAAQVGVAVSSLPPDVDSEPRSGALISDTGEYVTVTFPGSLRAPSSPPSGAAAAVRTSLMTAEGFFTGDYSAAGAKGLLFSLKYTGAQPPRVTVTLVPASGLVWFNNSAVKFSGEENVWQENNISFDLRSGWYDARGNKSETAWQAALKNVAAIGLDLMQVGTVDQSASVDKFRLLLDNEVVTPDAVLSDALFLRFGVRDPSQLTATQRALDSDGNGISDYQEIWVTQSDPDNSQDGLMVDISRTPEGKSQVKWTAVAGGEYRVEVAESPSGNYRALNGVERLRAAAKGVESTLDEEDASGLRFYRVRQYK